MASPLPTLQSRTTTIDHVGEDLLQNIVARLPALSFASIACVSRSWNLVCSRILCRPKLSSACSFNPSLHLAVAEVVDEVLSQPIRPHFAIASVVPLFNIQEAYELITAKLGSKVPLVTHCSSGIIGRDVLSHEFKEWKVTEEDDDLLEDNDDMEGTNKAIMLVVGFLPGMKVGTIPLLKQYDEACPCAVKIDKFITDIREFSTSISGCTSPATIILFTSFQRDITTVIDKMDYAMSSETVIVGDCCCYFLHTSKSSRKIAPRYERAPAGVALVFVKERNKLLGSGETQFHAVLSSGLIPVGPAYKATSVLSSEHGFSIALTARREGSEENVDGRSILNLAYEEIADRTKIHRFHIGVTKRRQHSTEPEKVGWMTSIAFHEVEKDNRETLLVNGVGINTGDTFRVYHPHSTISLSSVANVSDHMRSFKQGRTNGGDRLEVVGGLIFASVGRGESFFGQPNVDMALGGMLCARKIVHGNLSLYVKESEEQKSYYAMSPETVIVGGGCCNLQHASGSLRSIGAIALVFAEDINKPPGVGETQFHTVLLSELLPIGPTYKVTSIFEIAAGTTQLTVGREGSHENLDVWIILNQAQRELGRLLDPRTFFIRVMRRRRCSVGHEKVEWVTSLAFHRVKGYYHQGLIVDGIGIKTGYTFRFYYPDSTTAISSAANASAYLRSFKQGSTNAGDKRQVFGGLIFSSWSRGMQLNKQPNFDSSLFRDNFPGVTLGGMFTLQEIGRDDLTPFVKESQEQNSARCCAHELSDVYLIMSYTP